MNQTRVSRILGVSVDHPRGESSRIEVNIDRGLASGKVESYVVGVDEALSLAEQLLHSALIVKRVNAERSAPVDQ